MQTSLLQEFLNLRLLNIGPDDTRLEKLNEACQEQARMYTLRPADAIAPLLAAWDPNSGADPSLLDVSNLLQKHWPTFRGAFQDEPITMYRAIVLESVFLAMEQQGTLAVAISLLSSNVLTHLKVGQEEIILSKLVDRAKKITSERLQKSWPAQFEQPDIAPFKPFAMPKLKSSDPASWIGAVASAAGPGTNVPALVLENPNPHWVNQTQPWTHEFSSRMSSVVADVHDKAATTALTATSQALQTFGGTVITKLSEVLRSQEVRINHQNISTRLLWWRQALYSETADAPYRKLNWALIALHMAYDLADLLPEIYPPSVESLLYEAVRAANAAKCDELFPIEELLEALRQTNCKDSQWLQNQVTPSEIRALVIQALANTCATENIVFPKLGLDLSTKMSLGDWAIWLLREVKALDALSSPDTVEQPKEGE